MRGSLDASDWSANQHCEPANGPLRADLGVDAHARHTGYGPADASIWGRWPGHHIGAPAPKPAPSDEDLRPSSLASEPLFTHRTRDAWPVLVDALTIAAALGAILAVRAQLWSSVGTAIPWWALLPSVVGVRLLGLALFGVYRRPWTCVTVEDALRLIVATAVVSWGFQAAIQAAPQRTLLASTSSTIVLAEACVTGFALLATRVLAARAPRSWARLRERLGARPRARVAVWANGLAGPACVALTRACWPREIDPVVLVDGREDYRGMWVAGLPVCGPRDLLAAAESSPFCEAVIIDETVLARQGVGPDDETWRNNPTLVALERAGVRVLRTLEIEYWLRARAHSIESRTAPTPARETAEEWTWVDDAA